MSAHAFTESERLRETFAGREQRMVDAELRAALVIGGGFLIAAAALAMIATGQQRLSLPLAAMYVLGVAAASKVAGGQIRMSTCG